MYGSDRQDPPRREAGRPACRAAHEVRARDQSQDRQGSRARHPAAAAGAGGPSHRMTLAAMTRRTLIGLLPPLVVGWPRQLRAQGGAMTTTTDEAFRVETTAGTDRKGRPIVWGYVYRLRGRGGGRPRLLLETLDTAGQPIAKQLVYVNGDLVSGRAYWEARVQTPGAAYRATVHSVISTSQGAP